MNNTWKKNNLEEKVFCPLPWYSLTGQENGKIGVCCMNSFVFWWEELWNIQTEKMSTLWNSSKIRELRRNMLSWRKSEYCKKCYIKEDSGVISMRQKYLSYLKKYIPWYIENTHDDGVYRGPIKKIDLRLSNLCNLACRMCSGTSSTERIPLDAKLGISATRQYTQEPYDTLNFWEDIENWKEVSELKFAWGEPLINPVLFRILSLAVERWISKNTTLTLLTNLTVIPEEIKSLIEKFSFINFQISIDGYGKSYEYIRIGARWQKLKENLEILLLLREKTKKVSIVFMPTVQRDNIYDFPKLYLFAKKNNIDIDVKPLIFPHFLSIQNIEENEKQNIIKLYQTCITKYSSSYEEIKKDFTIILSFMCKEKAQYQYMSEYREKTKIMDDFADTFTYTPSIYEKV